MPARVLVVDDEPILRRLLEINLRAAGFDVTTAARGEEALGEATATAPDAIVLDLGLPDLSGDDLLTRMRNIPGVGAVPVIVLSGTDRAAAGGPGYASRVFAHLTKPMDPAVVVETVARAIARAD
ncbi:MAG TPA: response regulator [Actinomycetota bacterium]|jgi:two-component system KDP operon response regulator KdpE|nr:response regulator [Actinomycetota bacterium]